MGSLRILRTYPKGDVFTGAAIQLRELAQGLAERGHEVTVVTRPSLRDRCRSQRDWYDGVKDARSAQ